MELLKNNKGITLIILVVTIIVLLILAGISISAITGGNNSMDKAKKAKDETAIKAEMEELQKIINQSAAKGIRHGNFSGSADSQTIRDALKKNKLIEENPDDVIIDGKNGWKVTGVKTGQKYKIRYDGEVTRIEELAPTKIYGKIADGVLYLRATEQAGYTEGTQWNDSSITKVIIEEPIAPTTCTEMFKNCSSIQTIENIENLHTENVNNMTGMFMGCNKLKKIDLSYLDTSKVNSMLYMFYNCSSLDELDLSNFDTSKVTNMQSMFYSCSAKKINLMNVNTSNVQNMAYMFYNCDGLLELNLNSFNTSNVKNMCCMFCNCNNLVTIKATNNFVVTSLTNEHMPGTPEGYTNSNNIFLYSTKLIGGNGTKYNSTKVDKEYARIDGGPSNPGYFTLKQ